MNKSYLLLILIISFCSCISSDENPDEPLTTDNIFGETDTGVSSNKAPYMWSSDSSSHLSDSTLNYGTYTVTISDSIE